MKPRTATLAGIALATGIFAILVYERRWISDDGLIFVRVARQIVAGNGPVFNIGERVEPCTSTLWTYMLAFLGAVTRADIARIAVVFGGMLSLAGIVVA